TASSDTVDSTNLRYSIGIVLTSWQRNGRFVWATCPTMPSPMAAGLHVSGSFLGALCRYFASSVSFAPIQGSTSDLKRTALSAGNSLTNNQVDAAPKRSATAPS